MVFESLDLQLSTTDMKMLGDQFEWILLMK
jgi:hypothetical protein